MRSVLIVLLLATPAFSQEFFGSGEALCWRPSSDDFHNQYNSNLDLDHDWSGGYRVALGLDQLWGWKTSWTYTAFSADDSRIWTGLEGANLSSYGDLDYQVHDFEVGREFWLHPRFKTEAFAGFRWGQIDYTLRDALGGANGSALVLHSNTDSYGARVGAKGRCYLPGQFSIFGQGAFSGLFSTTDNTGLSLDGTWDLTDNHENHGVDAAAGVAWECGLMEVSAGYEWNWWANSLQRRASTWQPDYEDLLLEGVFLRVTGKY
ncbi:MAG: hypothetical protein GXX96_09780 [Planctomycetaceae bacterium]|nr:hypothetical protein [Planctomycetaceae bacterium]